MEIDARGENCPIPVIKTKKALKIVSNEIIKVHVDNKIATENILKMAKELNVSCEIENINNEHYIATLNKEGENDNFFESLQIDSDLIVTISSNKMGEGDESLGISLMKAFIFSLTEQKKMPNKIIFFNNGAKLTTEGSDSIEDLKKLESFNVKIYTCGACLNFYNLQDKLLVGEATNMYNISGFMLESKNIISL